MDYYHIANSIQKYADQAMEEGQDILIIDPLAAKFLEQLKKDLEQWHKESITWSVDDFQQCANDTEIPDEYDPEKYQGALELMIRKHDSEYGITWDTIKSYLDEFCNKDEEDAKV